MPICRQLTARQLTCFWNRAIVLFIAIKPWIHSKTIQVGVVWRFVWILNEDWMTVYTSEWHHQDFGYISFVEITKQNDECLAEVCLWACTSVSVWYRVCWLLCHAFSLSVSVTPFKSTLKTSTEEEREGERNDHLKWRLGMGQVFWVTGWNEWLYQRRRGEWIADTVALKLTREDEQMRKIKEESAG